MRCNTVTPTTEICTEAKLLFIVQNYEVFTYRWKLPWLHDGRAKDKCILFGSNIVLGVHLTTLGTSDYTADGRKICRCLIEVLLQQFLGKIEEHHYEFVTVVGILFESPNSRLLNFCCKYLKS